MATAPSDPNAIDAAIARLKIPTGTPLVVGLSGGVDSTVLLHALVQRFTSERVRAVHVDHGLHADAAHWADHCVALAEGLGVRCEVVAVEVSEGGSLEANARRARYAAFARLVAPSERLLLAQHQDDQAETALLRLAQGRGLVGMAGDVVHSGVAVLRPFLELSRAAIEAYAKRLDLVAIDDPSNANTSHDRNFLRHELLPKMRERWPDVAQRITQVATTAMAQEAAGRYLVGHLESVELRQAPEQAIEVLRWWLAEHGEFSVARRALAAWLRRADQTERLDFPCKHGRLVAWRGRGYWQSQREVLAGSYRWQGDTPLRLPHGTLSDKPPELDLVVGFRSGVSRSEVGERLRRAGVLPWMRDGFPLLFLGDTLVSIPGVVTFDDRLAGVSWEPVDTTFVEG